MAVTLASLVARTRLELGDTATSFQATVVGDGRAQRFDLPQQPVSVLNFMAFITDPFRVLQPSTDYVLEEKAGVITLTNPLGTAQKMMVQGVAYRYFSDPEIELFVREAFVRHTHKQHPAYSLTTPLPANTRVLPDVEEPLVVYLATIEALWVLATDASTDIDISTPEGVMVPRSQRFQHIMGLIQMYEERYRTLAQSLNVGIARIEVMTLRRISKTTNRFVPVYVPREIDDRTPPVRVFPPIDRQV